MSQFNSKEFLRELSEELVTNFEKASRATTPGLIGSAREHEGHLEKSTSQCNIP
jgi:hypothetical protein